MLHKNEIEELIPGYLSELDRWYKTTNETKKHAAIYEVTLQKLRFRCSYWEDEMRYIVRFAIEIADILNDFADGEGAREEYEAIVNQTGRGGAEDSAIHELIRHKVMYNHLCSRNPRLSEIVTDNIPHVCRVGGAWQMLVSEPVLIHTIISVYEQFLYSKRDDVFSMSVYFLARAIMRTHSEEIRENTEESK